MPKKRRNFKKEWDGLEQHSWSWSFWLLGDRLCRTTAFLTFKWIYSCNSGLCIKWVEVIATKKADTKTIIQFLKKNIFCRFGTLRVLINNERVSIFAMCSCRRNSSTIMSDIRLHRLTTHKQKDRLKSQTGR